VIANLLNALLGLWLVYLAVLDPAWTHAMWRLFLAGVVVIVLAAWARATDFRKWQSAVDVLLGVLLLVLSAIEWAGAATPLVLFWGVFWPGVLVAVFSLWSVLYRRSSIAAEPEGA
jgi:hypothetical protein